MERDEVDDEDVAAPRRHHVEVRESCPHGPVYGPRLDGLDPEVVGEHKGEDGDALVVIRACVTMYNFIFMDTTLVLCRVRCMVADYLLFTLNYEVVLLPKIWAVPRAKRNFRM